MIIAIAITVEVVGVVAMGGGMRAGRRRNRRLRLWLRRRLRRRRHDEELGQRRMRRGGVPLGYGGDAAKWMHLIFIWILIVGLDHTKKKIKIKNNRMISYHDDERGREGVVLRRRNRGIFFYI